MAVKARTIANIQKGILAITETIKSWGAAFNALQEQNDRIERKLDLLIEIAPDSWRARIPSDAEPETDSDVQE